MKTKFLILFIIILLSGIIRTIYLDRIPTGINDDELHFVLNSKNIYFGQTNINDEYSSLIFSPILGPLSTNLFTARLPYAIIGCLSVLLIFLLTRKLTSNINLALISSFVATFNPWSIYVSRTSFDAPIAIFFFLLTLYLLSLSKPKFIYLSIITAFIAFNSYIGTKILYFPYILLTTIYLWKTNDKSINKHYLIAILVSLLVTINFIFTLKNQTVGNRINELQTPNSQNIIDQVNLERRQSVASTSQKYILTNKYTVYIHKFLDKYIYNFSTDILFISGDHAMTGSLWRHGYFYYIDIFLLLLGIIYLYLNYNKLLIFLTSLILLSPIPEAIRTSNNPSYVFHSSLQYPFLYIIIGAGILFVWQMFKSKYIKIIFILIYIFSIINFIDIYFYKSPIYQPESFVFGNRILSQYINQETQQGKVIYVLSQNQELLFKSYLFYTNSYTQNNYPLIKEINKSENSNIIYKNIHFINHSKYLPEKSNYTLIFDSLNFDIPSNNPQLYISSLKDAGKIFTINDSQVCANKSLSTYPYIYNLSNLNIEKLSSDNFCQMYINK